MSGRPHLSSVPAPSDEAPSARSADGESHGRRRPWAWVLLGIALLALALQWRRAADLEQQAAALSAALAAARRDVEAHEQHLERIREQVGGLRSELEALDLLVRENPTEPDEPSL